MGKLPYIVNPMKYSDLFEIPKIKKYEDNILCGVYFLVKDNSVIYIGQSSNIINRLTGHKEKNHDSVFYILCKKEDLLKLESHYIIAFNPILNKKIEAGAWLNTHRIWIREDNKKRKLKKDGE